MTELSEQSVTSNLTKAEQRLLGEMASGQLADVVIRTGTTVDVGEWFKRGHVVGACLGNEWVMFATGRQPFVERVPTRVLSASAYNHFVGELVLAPASGVRLRQLKMTPLEAGRALRWILNVNEEAAK